jgi:hypothetical protein
VSCGLAGVWHFGVGSSLEAAWKQLGSRSCSPKYRSQILGPTKLWYLFYVVLRKIRL